MRLLLVEDEKRMAEALCELLRHASGQEDHTYRAAGVQKLF